MTVLLQLPETPRRGRSRFSKALPIPPPSPQIVERRPTTPYSRLPPLPIMATNAVNRRPVGGAQVHSTNTSIISMNSVSSVYSDSPGFSSNDSKANATAASKDSLSDRDLSPAISPPLPLKDPNRSLAKETDNALATRDGFQPSPPRTELWKRRSLTKDRGIVFPELQLEMSNGSTASLPKTEVPAIANQLPRSVASRKPVPLQKDPIPLRGAPQPPDVMGNKLARLGEKLSKLTHNDHSEKMKSNQSPAIPVHPSSGRLPTPEYQRTDKQQPPTLKVLSPKSPETPPNDRSPQVPNRLESRSTSGATLVSAHDLPPTFSLTTSGSHTLNSSPKIRPPPTKKTLPIPVLTPEPSPSSNSFSPPTIRSPDASRSPTTLRSPGIKSTITFPKQAQYSPPGTVLPALPLNVTHLECYASHKNMRKTNNQICPVACMLCQKKDSASRWRCTWCCVSLCAGCMQAMEKLEGKDLRKVGIRVEGRLSIGGLALVA